MQLIADIKLQMILDKSHIIDGLTFCYVINLINAKLFRYSFILTIHYISAIVTNQPSTTLNSISQEGVNRILPSPLSLSNTIFGAFLFSMSTRRDNQI